MELNEKPYIRVLRTALQDSHEDLVVVGVRETYWQENAVFFTVNGRAILGRIFSPKKG